MGKPFISILCTTYNHERFIGRALDSFLSQKTHYDFEIVIRDDASTDGTRTIIERYARENPNLIKLILEEKNQYSMRGGRQGIPTAAAAASGKYLALCEGDDFWIDEHKLEKQVSYMEAHQACTFIFTNAMLFNDRTQLFTRKMLPWPGSDFDTSSLDGSRILGTEDVLRVAFLPTASFLFKKEDYDRRPRFSEKAFTGDRYLQLVLTEFGYAYYMDEVTSAYRVNNPASMMSQWAASNEATAQSCWGFAYLYRDFNNYTNGKYSSIIEPLQVEREYDALFSVANVASLKNEPYRSYARGKGPRARLGYDLMCAFPKVYLWLREQARHWRS